MKLNLEELKNENECTVLTETEQNQIKGGDGDDDLKLWYNIKNALF